jgi:hypothetical protein
MAHYSTTSVLFDGINEYADMGNNFGFNRLNSFSISCWINTTDTGQVAILGKMSGAAANTGYELYIDTSERLAFQLSNNEGGGNYLRVRDGVTINDGQWKHICVTYTGSSTAAGVTIYKDGSPIVPVVDFDNLTASILNASNFNLSRRDGAATYYYRGNIDEVAMYNVALTGPDVVAIFNNREPNNLLLLPTAPNLVAWWRMGEGDIFPTLTDQIAAVNGTMINMEAGDIERNAPIPMFINGNLLPGGAEGFKGSRSIKETSMYLVMQAKDSVLGTIHTWTVQKPDFEGRYYPGPNLPTEITVRSIWDHNRSG